MKWTTAETETETRESKTTRAVGPSLGVRIQYSLWA